MLRVRKSLNDRLNGFSYMFIGPFWCMLRLSSLQVKNREKETFYPLRTEMEATPEICRSVGAVVLPLRLSVCGWKNER